MNSQVTASRMRELALRAEKLAAAIDAARDDFRRVDDDHQNPVRRAGFRLEVSAGWARQVAYDMRETAADLARLAARPADACVVPWGVCPEHGNTLISTGRQSRCRACGQVWPYDRLSSPCTEPARWLLTDRTGAQSRLCDAHTRDAAEVIDGARVEFLNGSELRRDLSARRSAEGR
jgi:hypothetical protein